jgi:hypothetical protein
VTGAIIIPYHRAFESFCPKCNSLGTEYHPTERRGRCHTCGFAWRFPPHRRLLYAPGYDPREVIR